MRFRLAALMSCTVAELDARMTHDEFIEWCAFYYYEPWGCQAEDDRWKQMYSLFWTAHLQGEPPAFLQRYPVEELDPLQLILEARLAGENEEDDEIE